MPQIIPNTDGIFYSVDSTTIPRLSSIFCLMTANIPNPLMHYTKRNVGVVKFEKDTDNADSDYVCVIYFED